MITLDNTTVGYGSRILIQNACATIPAGELTALLGRNGAGKSTLLYTVAGLRKAQGGKVLVAGNDISCMDPSALARTVSFVTTEKVRIPSLRCEELVAMGRAPYTGWSGKLRGEDIRAVRKALALVGMEEFAGKTMDRMSDGECQRIMIARALAQDTPVIILDEPTSFLDLPNRYSLCSLLGRLAREQGKCILFSTHELDIALGLCDSVALIDTPRLVHMPAGSMAASGILERLFGTSMVSFNAEDGSMTIRRI